MEHYIPLLYSNCSFMILENLQVTLVVAVNKLSVILILQLECIMLKKNVILLFSLKPSKTTTDVKIKKYNTETSNLSPLVVDVYG